MDGNRIRGYKEGLMGLIPGACKRPGSRLAEEMDNRVECPTCLQEKRLLFGTFPEVGFQEI
jgi:hypothetical protein